MNLNRSVLYLDRDSIEALNVSMARIIDVVEASLIEKAHGRVQMPPKSWMQLSDARWFAAMASIVPAFGHAALKWQSGSTENARKGLPYITGLLFLTRLDDGVVVSIMDSTWITQQRTAAASAVAVKHLARDGSDSFSILGCGVQARSHLDAIGKILPGLREVICFDTRSEAARSYADIVESRGLRARVVQTAREAVEASDVVITAGPIEPNADRPIRSDWLHAGMLGITLDYDCYWRADAFSAADVLLTDDIDQIAHIKDQGYFVGCPTPHGELGQVAAGMGPGREDANQTIICMNMGVSVEDVATATEIYKLATARKVGREVPL